MHICCIYILIQIYVDGWCISGGLRHASLGLFCCISLLISNRDIELNMIYTPRGVQTLR